MTVRAGLAIRDFQVATLNPSIVETLAFRLGISDRVKNDVKNLLAEFQGDEAAAYSFAHHVYGGQTPSEFKHNKEFLGLVVEVCSPLAKQTNDKERDKIIRDLEEYREQVQDLTSGQQRYLLMMVVDSQISCLQVLCGIPVTPAANQQDPSDFDFKMK